MRTPVIAFLLLAATIPSLTAQSAPTGWLLAGTQPDHYITGTQAGGIAFLASKTSSSSNGFGTLMQTIRADRYAGKRIRFQASVRSENVAGWAGLWMRVDKGSQSIVLDNMQTRPIKGTTGWQTYEVVLDVPQDATTISFGTLVDAAGEIWLNHASFEAVSLDIPTTASPTPASSAPLTPVNLDFRN